MLTCRIVEKIIFAAIILQNFVFLTITKPLLNPLKMRSMAHWGFKGPTPPFKTASLNRHKMHVLPFVPKSIIWPNFSETASATNWPVTLKASTGQPLWNTETPFVWSGDSTWPRADSGVRCCVGTRSRRSCNKVRILLLKISGNLGQQGRPQDVLFW